MSETAEQWLKRNKLDHLVEIFERQRVTIDLFEELTEADLSDLGMTIGDRKVFQRAMRGQKQAQQPDTPGPESNPDGTKARSTDKNTTRAKRQLERIAERRLLTIVFIDLVGSTALATQMDAEEFHEILKSYLGTVKEITESFGGHVLKYLGDGVLSVFGWPVAHEDQSERAVFMALEVVRAVETLSPAGGLTLKLRTGIASGSMVVGDIAEEVNDITGPAANLAQRLQSHAQPDEIVIDEITRSTLPEGFGLTALGSLSLKGFSKPVEAYRVDSADAVIRRQRPSTQYAQPIIGRDDELRELDELWSGAQSGSGNTVIVRGDSGMGKTRLVWEFVERNRETAHYTFWLQCFEYRSVSAMYPLLQELMRSAGFNRIDDMAMRRSKLSRFLVRRCSNPGLAFPLFATLLSIATEEDEAILAREVPDRARQALEFFVELTLSAARDFPVMVIVEDCHWADPSTIRYCQMLSEKIACEEVLLVLVTRPQWVPTEDAFLDAETIQLAKLKRNDSRRVVEQAIGAQLSPTVFEAILQRGEDIPLYLEELARTAADTLPGDELPPSIQSSLIARIDRLGADRPIIHLLSVLGLTFSIESVVEISNYDWPTLATAFGRMVDAGLLLMSPQAGLNHFQFKHVLIQEASYASVLRRTRRKLHNLVAEALLRRLEQNKYADPEVLARHLSLASRPAEAIPFRQAAGDRLATQSAYTEAAQQYEKGLADVAKLAPGPLRDEHEYELRVRLSAALLTLEGWSAHRVEENYEIALTLSNRLNDPNKQFVAVRGRFNVLFLRGNLSAARKLVDQLAGIAQETGDNVLIAEALKADGGCAVHEADFEHAAKCFEKSLEIFPQSSSREKAIVFGTNPVVISLAHLAWANWFLGNKRLANKNINQALKLARSDEHAFSEAYAEGFASCLCQFRADAEGARLHAENVIGLSEKFHFTYFEGWGRILLGWSMACLGTPVPGAKELDRGISIYRRSGAELILPYAYALRCEVNDMAKQAGISAAALGTGDAFPATLSESRFYPGSRDHVID